MSYLIGTKETLLSLIFVFTNSLNGELGICTLLMSLPLVSQLCVFNWKHLPIVMIMSKTQTFQKATKASVVKKRRQYQSC